MSEYFTLNLIGIIFKKNEEQVVNKKNENEHSSKSRSIFSDKFISESLIPLVIN